MFYTTAQGRSDKSSSAEVQSNIWKQEMGVTTQRTVLPNWWKKMQMTPTHMKKYYPLPQHCCICPGTTFCHDYLGPPSCVGQEQRFLSLVQYLLTVQKLQQIHKVAFLLQHRFCNCLLIHFSLCAIIILIQLYSKHFMRNLTPSWMHILLPTFCCLTCSNYFCTFFCSTWRLQTLRGVIKRNAENNVAPMEVMANFTILWSHSSSEIKPRS